MLAASSQLVALVGTKIFRTQADDTAVAPYVVWGIVAASPENNLAELPEVDDSRIQIDCYSLSQRDARRMCEYARAALESTYDVVFGPEESKEPDTKLWRWLFHINTFA